MLKKFLCFLLTFYFVFFLTGCLQKENYVNKNYNFNITSRNLMNGNLIAENDKYKLIWNSNNCSVFMIDKLTGEKFGTIPETEGELQLDDLGMPIKKHPMLESAVIIEYLNPNNNIEESALSAISAIKNGKVVAKPHENGVIVEYYFEDANIMIPIDYVLRKDSVSVSVNTKDIQENKNRLTSISLMPFWCSNKNDTENSYLFYPSGSGAIIQPNTISSTGVIYSSQVYGQDPVMPLNDKIKVEKEVRLPVFGSKSGDKASLAIIEGAAESASIETNVGSSVVKYSDIYVKFHLRGYARNRTRFLQGLKKDYNVYSSNMIENKLIVGFYPLIGNDANYTGMANRYKKYLKSDNLLVGKSDDRPINLSFIGGIMVDEAILGIPYKSLLAATTLNDVQTILKDINNEIKSPINAKLVGFGTSGLDNNSYAGEFKIGKKLGTKKDFANLSHFCKKYSIDLYFDFDLIKMKRGYSKYFDVAYNSLDKIAYIYDYNLVTRSKIDNSKYNLLSRELLIDSSNKMLKKINKWDLYGISINSLSNIAYSDYSVKNTSKYYSKGNMPEDVTKIYDKISRKYKIAGSCANEYSAVLSDVVYDCPSSSSGEIIFSYDIPFYQMIFKGNIALAGEPINTSSNWQTEFLRTVESGSGLNYILTKNYYKDFINFNGNYFFCSKYDDFSEKIVEEYNMIKGLYKKIKGREIVSHKILENGLRETAFENGIKIYVNYSDNTLQSPLGEVGEKNFIWGEK